MRRRSILRFEPFLEHYEQKLLLSGGAAAAQVASNAAASAAASGTSAPVVPKQFYVFRITNPTKSQVKLIAPFLHTPVQATQPVPGQVYNLLYVVVKNGTVQTFNASNNFRVRLTNQTKSTSFPALTGSEQWLPGKWTVFYVLTKKYYPVSEVAQGFQLDLGGKSSTLVPGPSGIFLRLKYNPATFGNTLDWIVAQGQGAQLSNGPRFGMPDTAINQLVAGRTHKIDFGGHF